jgi:tRNA pseudouridine38-40 synthase
MMGQLYELGKGSITLNDVQESLNGEPAPHFTYIAPASGLLLKKIHFKTDHQ